MSCDVAGGSGTYFNLGTLGVVRPGVLDFFWWRPKGTAESHRPYLVPALIAGVLECDAPVPILPRGAPEGVYLVEGAERVSLLVLGASQQEKVLPASCLAWRENGMDSLLSHVKERRHFVSSPRKRECPQGQT